MRARAREAPTKKPLSEEFTGGIQRREFEPVTVLPGRWSAISSDIDTILAEFERRLGHTGSVPLPRFGVFNVFRSAFREHAFSMVLENAERERARDLFQYICGVCWLRFLESSFIYSVGIVFLVYLLFHTQTRRHMIPVDIVMLEALVALKEHCENTGVMLECAMVIFSLCDSGCFSVGLRASYRSLQFDFEGKIVERKAGDELRPKETSQVPVETRRLKLAKSNSCKGKSPPKSVTHGDDELMNLSGAIQDAREYDAQSTEGGASAGTSEALTRIGKSIDRYDQSTPPPPVFPIGETRLVSVPRRKSRRELAVVHHHVPSDSEDSLPDKLGGPVAKTHVEAAQVQSERCLGNMVLPVRPRTKRARQSTLVGLEKVLAQMDGGVNAKDVPQPNTLAWTRKIGQDERALSQEEGCRQPVQDVSAVREDELDLKTEEVTDEHYDCSDARGRTPQLGDAVQLPTGGSLTETAGHQDQEPIPSVSQIVANLDDSVNGQEVTLEVDIDSSAMDTDSD